MRCPLSLASWLHLGQLRESLVLHLRRTETDRRENGVWDRCGVLTSSQCSKILQILTVLAKRQRDYRLELNSTTRLRHPRATCSQLV